MADKTTTEQGVTCDRCKGKRLRTKRCGCVVFCRHCKGSGRIPDASVDLTTEQALAELREMFPRWKYFALTVAIGAPIRRFSLKVGPSFYSPTVRRFDEDTLSEAMAQVRQWHAEQAKESW